MIYEVRTEPWGKGLVIHIYDDQGKFFAMSQTHIGYPDDTVESMARDCIAVMNPGDTEIEIVRSLLPPKE